MFFFFPRKYVRCQIKKNYNIMYLLFWCINFRLRNTSASKYYSYSWLFPERGICDMVVSMKIQSLRKQSNIP